MADLRTVRAPRGVQRFDVEICMPDGGQVRVRYVETGLSIEFDRDMEFQIGANRVLARRKAGHVR